MMAFIWYSHGVYEPYDSPITPTAASPPARRADRKPQDQFTRVQQAYEHAPQRPRQKQQAVAVKQIMSAPAVTLPADASLDLVWRVMEERRFRHVPIVDHGTLVGIVSDRDVMRQAIITAAVTVGEIMTRKVLTVAPETEIRDAARVMVDERIHALPVVDEDRAVVGIVTTSDILRCVVNRASLDLWV